MGTQPSKGWEVGMKGCEWQMWLLRLLAALLGLGSYGES